jgi:hypothetical protein
MKRVLRGVYLSDRARFLGRRRGLGMTANGMRMRNKEQMKRISREVHPEVRTKKLDLHKSEK